MSAARTLVLILSLGSIALTVVAQRWDQTRLEADLLRGESQWVALRRDWWSLQAQTATLTTPARMRRRAAVRRLGWEPMADSTVEYGRPQGAFYDTSRFE